MPASSSTDNFKTRVILQARREIEVGIGEEDDKGDREGKAGHPEPEGHCRIRDEGHGQMR